tara:strand:+ start:336 stop:464 length:129 start_codon:yes stop_codon:yes gene_type:complete
MNLQDYLEVDLLKVYFLLQRLLGLRLRLRHLIHHYLHYIHHY